MRNTSSQSQYRYGVSRHWLVWVGSLLVVGVVYAKVYHSGPTPEQIEAGRVLFTHEWKVRDSLCGEGDGLGPVFNANSCVACHSQGGVGGGGSNEHNVTAFEVDPDRDRTEVVNHVVHADAVSPEFQETHETVQDLFRVIPGGVRIVGGCTVSLADHNPVTFQEINSPALFGLGVLDDISPLSLTAHHAKRTSEKFSEQFKGNYKQNGSGFTRTIAYGKIGKFGWKGQFATVKDFVAAACAMELGLTNPYKYQPIPREHNEDTSAKLDMTHKQVDELVAFVKSLPPPQQILPEAHQLRERAIEGEAIFERVRCTDCHVKDLGAAKGVYTDFQLYSLERKDIPGGGGLYGGGEQREIQFDRPGNVPLPEHWKTPPLWGVADSAPYFHDGSARTLEEAIQKHFGSAHLSHTLYNQQPKDDQQKLLEFLGTLRAPQLQPATIAQR
jgi:CxxC motif-containing protein (DUF1111 family)